MQIYVFRGGGRVFGFTCDHTGGNLPTKFGPWSSIKSIELVRGQSQPGVNVDECLTDVERHGFHVTDAHVRITDEVIA